MRKFIIGWTLLFVAHAGMALTPAKSPNDDRAYQSYTLKNGLKVLLVSDPDSTKAAAALDVAVGSGADPVGRQGLAHFLEHMLFLGTRKYPESGDYQEFISSHGGGHNAYTSFENTNYFFDIDAGHLEPALDRFAQFFVAPLFNEEYVEREINAVESEYRAKLKEDSRRSLDVFKAILNPEHPFRKLAVGNLQTLRDGLNLPAKAATGVEKDAAAGATADSSTSDAATQAKVFKALRADLLDFHAEHYVASNMALVVLGAEPLEQLKAMTDARFAAVARAGSAKNSTRKADAKKRAAVPLYEPGFLPKRVSIEPEKQTRNLSISFPIPEIRSLYRYKPSQYIGNIIGHEGEGSLLSMLKNKGWAESLSAGTGLEYEGGATFNVSITLTEAGLQQQDTIIAALHSLINTIRERGLQRWRYNEQREILSTAFRFQEQGRAIGYVSSLASGLQHYPAREALRGPYLMKGFKSRQVKNILAAMTPDNALITVMAKEQEFDSISPWYDTPYKVNDISAASLALWQQPPEFAELKLPQENPFIAEQFTLLADGGPDGKASAPKQLETDANTELWWAADSEFLVPKAQMFFNISSRVANGGAREAALTQLYAGAIADGLNEISYPALLAGVSFSVRAHSRGLSIRVGGYNDKQDLLLEKIAAALALESLTAERLVNLHTELLRRWENLAKRLPYQQLFGGLNQDLVQNSWGADKLIQALETVSLSELQQHSRTLRNNAELQALALGNLSADTAERQAKIIAAALSCDQGSNCAAEKAKVRQLQAEQWFGRDLAVEHADSAMLMYVQGQDQSYGSQAMMALTAQVLQADYFQQLRTNQQLGYVVFATAAPLIDVPGLAFIVQSPTHSVGHIAQASRKFLAEKRAQLDSEEFQQEFEQHRSAVLSELREKAKNMSEKTERYWSDLTMGYPGFNRRSQLIEAVEGLSYAQWRDFFAEEFSGGVMIWSQGQRELGDLSLDVQNISSGELRRSGPMFTVGESRAN